MNMSSKRGVHQLIIYLSSTLLWISVDAYGAGFGQLKLDAAGIEITVFTYRPPSCDNPSVLFVFHGLNRKAEGVRNKAVNIAQDACLMVFAPLFDKQRFPNWRYHRAGVVHQGQVLAPSSWTAPILHALIEQARQRVSNRNARMYLFGHSAGGQFLSRIAAYSPLLDVDRIIIANPSVYVSPLLSEKAPNGFAGVFSAEQAQYRLKTYLELPIVIYLGQQDTGDKNLVTNKAAMKQGENRLQRGRNIFNMAKRVALENGWAFNWRLIEVPGIGHSSRGMLEAKQLRHALGLESSQND